MTDASVVALTLIDELARQGVREVVLSPGSRSAPLALAAAAHPDLRVHVRVDERGAAFMGLGLARGAGGWPPALVICSSGTAVANHHPAVLEADLACVPVILLTADRPHELRDTGANQTADQVHLHGRAVRWFHDVGDGGNDPGSYLRSVAARAVAEAGEGPGPVHLNVPLREPLVSQGAEMLDPRPGRPFTTVTPRGIPHSRLPALPRAATGLIVAGDGAAGDAGELLDLAEQLGWPVLAEPTSGLRSGRPALRCGHWLTSSPAFADEHVPELVVQVGRPILSRPISALIDRAAKVVTCDPLGRWSDPQRNTALMARSTPAALLASLLERDDPAPDHAWLSAWLAADDIASGALDAELDGAEDITELGLTRDTVRALSPDAILVTASSLPIRHLNEVQPVGAGPRIIGNRGVSGIDGFVSTAVGVTLAHDGPTAALAGDLSIVHDTTGLVIGPDEPRPSLPIVVLNNDGGAIFSLLPYGKDLDPPTLRRLFTTPHHVDLEALAKATNTTHRPLTHPKDLPALLDEAWSHEGITLIEARTDADRETARYHEVREAITAAIAHGQNSSTS